MDSTQEAITVMETPRQSSAMVSVEEIEVQIRRAERLADALDKIRRLAVARTVPGDWVDMGGNVYLEGDGALRIAPMIGLHLANVRKSVELAEDNVVRITMTCDAESMLFGTRFSGISRTRTSIDPFLTQNGKKEKADLEDVESSAYKGMVARAVQLLAGLSGLSREDLKTRFGTEAGGEVKFKTGASDAKKADAGDASDNIKEVHRILVKLFGDDKKAAGEALEAITEKKGPDGFPGIREPNKLTARRAEWAVKKLREMEARFDKEVLASEGGAE